MACRQNGRAGRCARRRNGEDTPIRASSYPRASCREITNPPREPEPFSCEPSGQYLSPGALTPPTEISGASSEPPGQKPCPTQKPLSHPRTAAARPAAVPVAGCPTQKAPIPPSDPARTRRTPPPAPQHRTVSTPQEREKRRPHTPQTQNGFNPARTRKTPPPRPASRARPPPPPPKIRTRLVSTPEDRVRKMIPVTVCGACRPEVLAALPLVQHRCDIVNTLAGDPARFFCHSVIEAGTHSRQTSKAPMV